MSDTPQLLLAHHLKALKLPTFLREYDKLARQCAAEGVDHVRYLLRLAELELIERERRMVERRIKEARFPAVKSLDSFDFLALPSLNKALVLELARSEYVARRENIIAVGNSGTGKTHIALGLGLAACQKGLSVGFTTAAALVHELIEARDEKRLLRLQRQVAGYKLLIIDELGYVPLSQTGAELLFEVFSQRYERGSTIVTSNLPFDEWTGVFASERLTGALLDRLTHHVHILEMNGDSYRLKQSKRRRSERRGWWPVRVAAGPDRSRVRSTRHLRRRSPPPSSSKRQSRPRPGSAARPSRRSAFSGAPWRSPAEAGHEPDRSSLVSPLISQTRRLFCGVQDNPGTLA
jgi:DNA replication protein DnaC